MKKIILLLFFTAASLITYSQNVTLPIDSKTGKITYSEVVNVDSANSEALYLRVKEWFVHTFNSANDVIQMDDRESKKLIGKARFDVSTSYLSSVSTNSMGYVKFSVEVQAKDGRYKYIFTDFWHEQGSSKANSPGDLRLEKPGGGLLSMGMKNWNGVKTQTNDYVTIMIKSLKEAMGKDLSGSSEW